MLGTKTWLRISLMSALLIPLFIAATVFASPATNVGLTRFEAIPQDNAVRLEWDTETELETAGFMLKRGQNGSFAYVLDPDGSGDLFIFSQGGPAIGSNYVFIDEMVVNEETYTYQLIEVEVNGTEIMHAETTITVGMVPTNTPIVVAGGSDNGGNNETNATTETVTATVTASSTATATTITTSTSPTNSTAFPSPTPSPSVLQTIAPATVVVDEEPPRLAAEQVTAQSGESARDANQEAVATVDAGAAVAFAQEDPLSSPESETVPATPLNTVPDTTTDPAAESPAMAEPDASLEPPRVIGATPYPVGSSTINPDSEFQDTETVPASSGLVGRVYLWIAFIASIVIFIAAVIGAILLYTRQRSKE